MAKPRLANLIWDYTWEYRQSGVAGESRLSYWPGFSQLWRLPGAPGMQFSWVRTRFLAFRWCGCFWIIHDPGKQPQQTHCITRLDLVGIVPLTPYMGWIDVRWHLVRNASKLLTISKTSTEGLWWLLPPCSDKICTRWSFYKSDQKSIIIPKTATA